LFQNPSRIPPESLQNPASDLGIVAIVACGILIQQPASMQLSKDTLG
jgi:hypothetical protein